MYKCIKEFTLEKCDDDGFTIEGEYTTIEEGSIWNVPEDENYRLIGGEIRLEEDIEGLEIVLKDGSKLEITELNWDLINEAERGNVRELNIDDFEIYEEKQS